MSVLIGKAEIIEARLRRLVLLAGTEVVIDRQLNVVARVKAAFGKQIGAVVTILWAGSGLDEESGEDGVMTEPGYMIRLWTLSVLRANDTPADDLIEAMVGALHNYKPEEGMHSQYRFRVTGDVDLVPDNKFLIYEFPVSCRAWIPAPEFLPL